MRIGILETGRPPEELAATYPIYPAMVADWLEIEPDDWTHFAALDNELPDSPSVADLWVITGSKFSAYQDLDWIKNLENFIRSCHETGTPMVGICFGHQLIAQALGGRVEKAETGWGLGVHEYPVTYWPDELGEGPNAIAIQAYHQDQVTQLPDGAEVIASTDFCPIGAVWYPGFALTFQGHPEFSNQYATDLIESRRGTVLTEQDADRGQAVVGNTTNRALLSKIIRTHLMTGDRAPK